MILYNSLMNKKLILSEFHFRDDSLTKSHIIINQLNTRLDMNLLF